MFMNEYQNAAVSTAIYRAKVEALVEACDPCDPAGSAVLKSLLRISYTGLGLGEAGEAQNKIKKILRDSGGVPTAEQRKEIAKELGGILWYVANCADEIGYTLDEVAALNIEQLRSRAERGVLSGSGDNR